MIKMRNKVTGEIKNFSSIDSLDVRIWEHFQLASSPIGNVRVSILTPIGIISAVKEVRLLSELSNYAVMNDNSFLSTTF